MSQRDRLIVCGIVFLALAGAMWMMVVSPKRAEVSRLDDQIATAQSDLATANQQKAAAEAARRNYGLDVKAVAALKKALPDDDQTAQLLYQLNKAAGHANIKLQAITPGVAGAPPTTATAPVAPLPAGVEEVGLDLSFQGRYGDLQRFLDKLEHATVIDGDSVKVNGRLISVKAVSLTVDPTGNGGVEAKVTAAAYVTAPVAPGTTIPGATVAPTGAPAATTTAPAATTAAPAATTAAPATTTPPTQPTATGGTG